MTARKTAPETPAPPTPPTTPEAAGKRGVRLRTSKNITAEIGRVYRSYRRGCGPGPLDATQARTCGFLLQTLASVLRDEQLGDIEEQLGELKRLGVVK